MNPRQRYELLDVIGHGAAGVVHLARDRQRRSYVAAKVLTSSTDDLAKHRFLHEQQVAVAHSHLLTPLDWFQTPHSAVLIMELADAGTIEDVLGSNTVVSPNFAEQVANQSLTALEALHTAGIIHRDIKPGNLMLQRSGAGVTVQLGDFGISVTEGSPRLTQEVGVVGTLGYLAPEVLAGGDHTAQSDLWSLGRTISTLTELCDPPISRRLAELVEQLTEDNPNDRPRSAADALAQLDVAAVDGPLTIEVIPGRVTSCVRRDVRRRRLRAALSGAAAATVVALLAVAAYAAGAFGAGPVGRASVLVPGDASLDARVTDAVNFSFLAYELAGTRDPATVRLAATQLLQGDDPCFTYADCKRQIAEGARVRYIGVTAPSPLTEGGIQSYAQSARIVTPDILSAPTSSEIDGGTPLWSTVRFPCQSSSPVGDPRWGHCHGQSRGLYDRTDQSELDRRLDDECSPRSFGRYSCESSYNRVLKMRSVFRRVEVLADGEGTGRPFGYGAGAASDSPLTISGSVFECETDGGASPVSDVQARRVNEIVQRAVDTINEAGGVLERPAEVVGATAAADRTAWRVRQPVDIELYLDVPLCANDEPAWDTRSYLGRHPVLSIFLSTGRGGALVRPFGEEDSIAELHSYSSPYAEFNKAGGLRIEETGTIVLENPSGSPSFELIDAASLLGAPAVVVDLRQVADDSSGCPDPFVADQLPRVEFVCSTTEFESAVDDIELDRARSRRPLWVIIRRTPTAAAAAASALAERPVDLRRVLLSAPDGWT